MSTTHTGFSSIVPVVIGGDIGAYALGRQMHEAFGVRSICVAPEPIGAIAHSSLFTSCHVDRLVDSELRIAIAAIAREHAGRPVVQGLQNEGGDCAGCL